MAEPTTPPIGELRNFAFIVREEFNEPFVYSTIVLGNIDNSQLESVAIDV